VTNTLIRITYRTASNYKAHEEVVLPGPISEPTIGLIAAHAVDGYQVIPSEVGLPSLAEELIDACGAFDESDFVAHVELDAWLEGLPSPTELLTTRPATVSFTAEAFGAMVAQAAFDIQHEMDRLAEYECAPPGRPSA